MNQETIPTIAVATVALVLCAAGAGRTADDAPYPSVAPPSVAKDATVMVLGKQGLAQPEKWVATWASSPAPPDPDPDRPILNLQNQTVRERVRISAGGPQFRIRLTNEYGSSPLLVGSVTAAVPTNPAGVKSGSIQAVSFGGKKLDQNSGGRARYQ